MFVLCHYLLPDGLATKTLWSFLLSRVRLVVRPLPPLGIIHGPCVWSCLREVSQLPLISKKAPAKQN